MTTKHALFTFTLLAGAVAATIFFQRDASTQEDEATVGEMAPDFTLSDEAGNTHTLSQYRGQIVVLEWTSPECPYVQRHYLDQNMQNTAATVTESGAVWLAIDSSHFNTPDASSQWKAEMGVPYPILQDTGGAVGHLYGARTTPHIYVIDAEGRLRYQGAVDDNPRGRSAAPTSYPIQVVTHLLSGEQPSTSRTDPYGCTVKYE